MAPWAAAGTASPATRRDRRDAFALGTALTCPARYLRRHERIKKPRPGLGYLDGAKRIRTADPLHAMQVLYQLSYGPDRTPWHGMLVIPLGLWPCLTLNELTTPPV